MFARTERLLLRPGWAEDAPALARAIAHEAVIRNTARVPWPYAVADAAAFLHGAGDANLLILERCDGAPRLIGGIGLMAADAADERELGYWLTPSAWGRGYATEAGVAMMAIARGTLRLRRVQAGHFADNPMSGRVLRKLGFRATGRVGQRHSLARGGAVASVEFVCDFADAEDEARPIAA